jgi:hypothetical protein
MKYRVRYNKTKGQPGRGTPEHVWRVFDANGKEWLCKHVRFEATAWGELDPNGVDHNIVCEGEMLVDRSTSTVTIA